MKRLTCTVGRFFRENGCKLRRVLVFCLTVALSLGLVFLGFTLCISAAVKDSVKPRLQTVEALREAGKTYDCVLVLGCGVYADGTPSPMLEDRLLTGVAAMEAGLADRMVVSGDHRSDEYDEVSVMKDFVVALGIPSEQVFQDHDGYSTYDSIYRLKTVFGGKRVLIVSQEYHLSRALYLAGKLGMEADGIAADRRPYQSQFWMNAREMLARCKDVYYGLKQPPSQVTGDTVDLSGNGNDTHQSRPVSAG